MVRYLMRISYIGTKYRGCQNAPGFEKETIQGILEEAIGSVEFCNASGTHFASRTDKGVHALMNALHVDLTHKTPGEVFQPNLVTQKVNSYLKQNNHEIIVMKTSVVPDHFQARYDAKWRSYVYRLAVLKPEVGLKFSKYQLCEEFMPIPEVNRCHIVHCDLNIPVVQKVVNLYCGEHNFLTFTKCFHRTPWKNPLRVIEKCKFYPSPCQSFMHDPQYANVTMWEFYVQSRSFLYHQIRKLVGAALSAGFGHISVSDVEKMLKYPDPNMWMPRAGGLPPSCGLYLANIHYDREDFLPRQDTTEQIKEETQEEEIS